ncbi:hypothetical protein LTR36_008516 [Oleoguttula mirabilis]|uniref:Uncharacterized protein n=1 Tax=Oleoguttula mirabilis TaxID=1507867 RepID=A0AAV9JSS0_9PEZI|nr:hypothetical protein LTR36_008516 [Oleoguttula mirabilis]
MDPNTTSRKDWTNGLLDRPIPPQASPEWKSQVEDLKDLYRLLAFHSAMRPNMPQTFMTPANIKSKVYFMWDFVGRTLSFAYMVPPTLEGVTSQEHERWEDVIGRSVLAASLVLDQPPGMLDQMVDMSYPGQTGQLPFGQRPVLGEEIKEVAKKLQGNGLDQDA